MFPMHNNTKDTIMRLSTTPTQHPLSEIVLLDHDQKTHMIAFRDSTHADQWLTELCETHHKHKRTRKLVKQLGDLLYVIPAAHTVHGQVLVGEGR